MADSGSILGDDGTRAGGVTLFHDKTPTKGLEQVLRRAKEEAESAHRVKFWFLSNMSYEIRTPLKADSYACLHTVRV